MTIKEGDIYELGKHRIACGDALDRELVDKLVGGAEIRCVLTDPPYGVDYVAGKQYLTAYGKFNEDHIDIKSDGKQSPEEYKNFSLVWIKNIIPKLASYNAFYIFNSDLLYCALKAAMEEAGVYHSQMLVWVKSQAFPGRKDYLPMHEVIAYGWHGRHKAERGKGHSVFFHPKPARSRLHPTQKPVGLLRKMIFNSTQVGQGVYDPFLGSGSTLIACEHTNRVLYGIEKDHNYVKTIIARWEKLTGKKAKKI